MAAVWVTWSRRGVSILICRGEAINHRLPLSGGFSKGSRGVGKTRAAPNQVRKTPAKASSASQFGRPLTRLSQVLHLASLLLMGNTSHGIVRSSSESSEYAAGEDVYMSTAAPRPGTLFTSPRSSLSYVFFCLLGQFLHSRYFSLVS